MMMRSVFVVAALVSLALPSIADELVIDSTSLGQDVVVRLDGAVEHMATARFEGRLDGVSGYSFCYDPRQVIGEGRHGMRAGALESTRHGREAAHLLRTAGPSIDTAVEVTGISLAFWELAVDDEIDLAAGRFQVLQASPHARKLAAAYLATAVSIEAADVPAAVDAGTYGLASGAETGTEESVTILESSTAQDQLFQPGPAPPVEGAPSAEFPIGKLLGGTAVLGAAAIGLFAGLAGLATRLTR